MTTASSAISLHPYTSFFANWALQHMSLIVAGWNALNLYLSLFIATMWMLTAGSGSSHTPFRM